MRFLLVIMISTIVLFIHEGGHYCAARIFGLQIEEISFSWRPFPRFYVAIQDKNITNFKRIVYLLSGNLMTISLFVSLHFINFNGIQLILLIVSTQIIFETNPFLSDYSSIAFWIANKNKLEKIPKTICNDKQEKEIQYYLEELQNTYFLSPIWLFHFLAWTILLVVLLRMYAVNL